MTRVYIFKNSQNAKEIAVIADSVGEARSFITTAKPHRKWKDATTKYVKSIELENYFENDKVEFFGEISK